MNGDSNVNDAFFTGMFQDVWKLMLPEALTKTEIDFILDVCNLSEGKTLLDFMCGHGRHALALAENRIQVTAIDNQEKFVQEIQTKAGNSGLPLTAINSTAVDFKTDKKFDAIICMGNSFSFFNLADTKSIIENWAKVLNENGRIIISSWMIAEIAIRQFRKREWFSVEDYKYFLENTFKFQPTRIESTQTIISKEGKIETREAVDYLYSINELEELFLLNNLKIAALYATPRKKPFTIEDAQVYIVLEMVMP